MADIKPISGVFSAKVRKGEKSETKKFGFLKSHPPHINSTSGRSLHVETLITIANGEKVDVETVKAEQLEGFDKEAAQAALQHLVDVGYAYLVEAK